MKNDTITLNINGDKIEFNITPDLQERLINETVPGNRVTPMHNFLIRTVTGDSKKALMPLLEKPGMVMVIGSAVIEEYMPQVNITVGE